jgi:lysophospholipase L1-like esterase
MNTTTKKAANSIVGKLTAGILSTAAVAAALFAPPAAAFQSSGDAVLVIGDSLEVGSGPYLRSALPGMSLDTDAEKGRTSGEGVKVLADRLGPEHGVVVFPLGTNDSPSDPGGLAASLAAAGQLAGDRCIVVATIARPPLRGVSVEGLNRVVEQFAGQTGAQVADWRSVVRSIPSLLVRDGVHATGEGYGLRATLLAEAVQNCLLGGGPSGIPAPRDPNARPPRAQRSAPALLPVDGALDSLVELGRVALGPIAAALHAAGTAATKAGPEPVLGAP